MEKSFTPALLREDEKQAAKFIDDLREFNEEEIKPKVREAKDGLVFDSADQTQSKKLNDYVADAYDELFSESASSDQYAAIFDSAGNDKQKKKHKQQVATVLLDGISKYESSHDQTVPADILALAMHNAYSFTEHAASKFNFDDASSSNNHHYPHSLKPNTQMLVSLSTTLTTAIPFANYIPADIGSNEARLAIVTNHAADNFGSYSENSIIDGTQSGGRYLHSLRVHKLGDSGGSFSGKLTSMQDTKSDDDECLQDAPTKPLLAGRSEFFILGLPAAREVDVNDTGNSTVTGSIEIKGVIYTVSGHVNNKDATASISVSPPLPENHPIHWEGLIDYEKDTGMIPEIGVRTKIHHIFAEAWRGKTFQTIDSRTQMANELGMDPYSRSSLALLNQVTNERHYTALRKLKRAALGEQKTFKFDWQAQGLRKSRKDIWDDFSPVMRSLSQEMTERTQSNGATHAYVDSVVAANIYSLMSQSERARLPTRPGIHRIGKFQGIQYYFAPSLFGKIEGGASGRMLVIGRASDTAKNPIVFGSAVPPRMRQTSTKEDLSSGVGYYHRDFLKINPHKPAAQGCALVNIQGIN